MLGFILKDYVDLNLREIWPTTKGILFYHTISLKSLSFSLSKEEANLQGEMRVELLGWLYVLSLALALSSSALEDLDFNKHLMKEELEDANVRNSLSIENERRDYKPKQTVVSSRKGQGGRGSSVFHHPRHKKNSAPLLMGSRLFIIFTTILCLISF